MKKAVKSPFLRLSLLVLLIGLFLTAGNGLRKGLRHPAPTPPFFPTRTC